jgi:hypothetical protein
MLYMEVCMIVEQSIEPNSRAAQPLKPPQFTTVNVSKKRLEKFLLRWVNIGLPDEHAARLSPRVTVPSAAYNDEARKLRRSFPDMFLSESTFKSEQFVQPRIPAREGQEQQEMLERLEAKAQELNEERIAQAKPPQDWTRLLNPSRRRVAEAIHPLPTAEQIDADYVATIARFGRRLQILWDSPDGFSADDGTFVWLDESKQKRFVQLHYWLLKFFIHPASDYTPEMLMEERPMNSDPLDRLVAFVGGNLSRMKHCPRPECKHPYFLASRGNSKFCSPRCADWGRRQTQNRWWDAKGSAKRAAKRAASKPAANHVSAKKPKG